jgi:uncharacterized membrane protein YphA (DoxX/SURF4 family)
MGWRVAVGIFLIMHGLVHPAIWGPPSAPDAPWDTSRSWLLRGAGKDTRRTVAIVLATITAIGYVLAGVALLAGGGWWPPAAIVASVLSLVLLLSYFHPWLSFGVLLDTAIIWAAVAGWPE